MDEQTVTQLEELAGAEKALAVAVKSAASRVADEGMRSRLRDIGMRHQHQAEELERTHAEQASGDIEAERAIITEVEHAVGIDGVMAALSHVEREQEGRYRQMQSSTRDEQLREMLRQHLEAFGEDQRVFLDQSVGLGEIADPRRVP